MKTYARASTGALAAAGLIAGSLALAGAPTAQAQLTCNGKPVTMVVEVNKDDQVNYGTNGDDVVLLKGSMWHDFYAKGGNDTICDTGYGGDVYAGPGDDWISAKKAKHEVELDGGAGDDTIIGTDASGGYQDDTLWGGPGRDVIHGGDGPDYIYPDQTSDDLSGDGVKRDDADVVYGEGDGADVTITMLPAAKTYGADKIIGSADSSSLDVVGVKTKLNIPKRSVRAAAGGPVDHFTGRFTAFGTDATADVVDGPAGNSFAISGTNSSLDTGDGDDHVIVEGKNVDIKTGSGDDEVYYYPRGKKNRVSLGSGDDDIMLFGTLGSKIIGGPGDDKFKIRIYGEIGEGEGEYDDLLPLRAELLGKSGTDTMSWDCKSTVDVADHRLSCKRAKVTFGGMQIYKASRNVWWKDVFRGSSHREVFYGGGKDDVMYGRGGKDKLFGGKGDDYANGGPGKDSCKAETKVKC